MLIILTKNSFFIIEKPVRIYKASINGTLIKNYNLIIEDDQRHKFFILSSDCLDTIDRGYITICDRIKWNIKSKSPDPFIDFTNYEEGKQECCF